jgi:hypothetical protein
MALLVATQNTTYLTPFNLNNLVHLSRVLHETRDEGNDERNKMLSNIVWYYFQALLRS